MSLNLSCTTGRGTKGTELILDKPTGVKGSLKTIKPWSRGMCERNYTTTKEQCE